MSKPLLMRTNICVLCALLVMTQPGKSSAETAPPAEEAEDSLRSEPWVFESPLQANVLFLSQFGMPWMNPQSAWISKDGRHVAYFARDSRVDDGFSRTIVVKDVDKDATVLEGRVLSIEESRRGEAFRDAVAKSHAWELTARLRKYEFQPMAVMQVPEQDKVVESYSCYEKQMHLEYSLSLEQLKVSYREPALQVWRQDKKILDRQFPKWKLHQKGCQLASPSWMNRVFVDSSRGVMLVELEFCGFDHCLEPASAFHAVRIPVGLPPGPLSPSVQTGKGPQPPAIHSYKPSEFSETTYYATGFPAASPDGALVLLAETTSDVKPDEAGPRTFRVVIRRSGSDEVVWNFPLVTAQEVIDAKDVTAIAELDKKMREKIRQVNAYLGQTRWVTLVEQPVSPVVADFCQQAPAQHVQWGKRQLLFQQGHLRLEGGQAHPEAWIMPDSNPSSDAGGPPDAGTPSDGGFSAISGCGSASRLFIDSAYAEESTGVVLLRFASCQDGPDSCPNNFGGYHAFKWP